MDGQATGGLGDGGRSDAGQCGCGSASPDQAKGIAAGEAQGAIASPGVEALTVQGVLQCLWVDALAELANLSGGAGDVPESTEIRIVVDVVANTGFADDTAGRAGADAATCAAIVDIGAQIDADASSAEG
jgi:hypothetical protein